MMKLKIEFLKVFVLEFEFAWLRDKVKKEEENTIEELEEVVENEEIS